MHIVHFYQHGKDLMDVFAQFCCAGLQEGDCCFWLTTPPWTADLALHELAKRLPAAHHYVASGQLHLIPNEEWYLTKDVLDVEGTLARAPRVSKRLEAKDGRSFVFVGFRVRRAAKVNGWRVFSTNNKYTAW